jgi:hypothetical protein
MKKFFALAAVLAVVLAGCDLFNSDEDKPAAKLPSLTVKNESSFDLTDVKFSGITFTAAGSNDLPRTTQAVKQPKFSRPFIHHYLKHQRKRLYTVSADTHNAAFVT